jgi:hypothetical protein
MNLTSQDIRTVQAELERREKYFYHGTLDSKLDSIRKSGIHPKYEHERSSYFDRRGEPKAMRYCIKRKLCLALSAAETQAPAFDSDRGIPVPSSGGRALLRTPAEALLSRNFGLDYSHGPMAEKAKSILNAGRQLTADDFIDLVSEYGSISCYEVIPASKLEILQGDVAKVLTTQNDVDCIWVPLLG